MILQHLHGLSDPQAKEQLEDRLSFQRFVQLDTPRPCPMSRPPVGYGNGSPRAPAGTSPCTGQVPDTDACYTH